MANIQKKQQGELIEKQVQRITDFLDAVGLPSDNIIASINEREIINQNLPQYIASLTPGIKSEARYLSKFVVGAGFGLFDYSLNSIWNEVVISLRQKAITYGLEIFFDSAVGGRLRDLYKKEEDLAGLKDSVLLETCKKLELISETTFKKLAHILDMRNDIGISHPTNYSINAFELLGWLQTCVKDVLLDKPSEAAIQVKAFIDNLKSFDGVIEKSTIDTIEPQIKNLATQHCDNITRTLFGIYVSDDSSQDLRKNISLLLPIIWTSSSDEIKFKLGIILEGYNNNLNKKKYKRGEEYFQLVTGNKYRTTSEKVIALDNLATRLKDAHHAWDNYYHEVPIIENILSYIEASRDLPPQVASTVIHSVLLCRIGKGITYNAGVSPKGKSYYDKFFSTISTEYFPSILIELTKFNIQQRLSTRIGREQGIALLKHVKQNLVNDKYIECCDYLIKNLPNSERAIFDTKFKKISAAIIKWV